MRVSLFTLTTEILRHQTSLLAWINDRSIRAVRGYSSERAIGTTMPKQRQTPLRRSAYPVLARRRAPCFESVAVQTCIVNHTK